jgi:hypothetical protein
MNISFPPVIYEAATSFCQLHPLGSFPRFGVDAAIETIDVLS